MSDQPGYTRVPNALLELLPMLPEAEMRVLLVVIRKTTGWQKESDVISESQFRAATGMSRQGVINGVRGLMERGLLKRVPAKNNGFSYQAVHEVDSLELSTKLTSQRSRQLDVHEVDNLDAQAVHEVDTQKKESKEKKERIRVPRKSAAAPPLEKEAKDKTPSPVIQALADVCVIDRKVITKTDHIVLAEAAGKLYQAGREHGKTDDEIIATIRYFGTWFAKHQYWGRNKEAPTPALVRKLWKQAIDDRTNKARAAPQYETITAADKPKKQVADAETRKRILGQRYES